MKSIITTNYSTKTKHNNYKIREYQREQSLHNNIDIIINIETNNLFKYHNVMNINMVVCDKVYGNSNRGKS